MHSKIWSLQYSLSLESFENIGKKTRLSQNRLEKLIDKVQKIVKQHWNFAGPTFQTNKARSLNIGRHLALSLLLISLTPACSIVINLFVKYRRFFGRSLFMLFKTVTLLIHALKNIAHSSSTQSFHIATESYSGICTPCEVK